MTLEDILKTWGPALKRVAASYAPQGADREDLEQEIVFSIHQALPGFRGDAKLRTYVFRIAHNCGIQAIKRRTRQPVTEPLGDTLTAPTQTPEQRSLQRERYEQLAAALRRLPLSQRQPMTLRLEGMSYEEIGEVLGLTRNAVGVRLHRATQSLRSLMKEPS